MLLDLSTVSEQIAKHQLEGIAPTEAEEDLWWDSILEAGFVWPPVRADGWKAPRLSTASRRIAKRELSLLRRIELCEAPVRALPEPVLRRPDHGDLSGWRKIVSVRLCAAAAVEDQVRDLPPVLGRLSSLTNHLLNLERLLSETRT